MNSLEVYNNTQDEDLILQWNQTWPHEPRRDTLYVVIPVTVVYTLIFVTGVVGNIVTCIVIAKNKYMHTATNYYLFSLAISDLLLLITGLPQEMVSIWVNYPYLFGEAFCVLRGYAAETSANATVLTITAFTVERYIAICYPFLSHTMSKLSRAVKLIIVIWVVSLIFAAPYAAQVGVLGSPESASCTLKRVIFDHSFEISTLIFFVVPMVIITVLYALIGLKLRGTSAMKYENGRFYKSHDEQRGARSRRHQLPTQSSRRVVNMLAAVVVAFFICWAPFHTQRLVAIYGTDEDNIPREPIMIHIYSIVTYISGIFYYLSATINPILYHIMSLKFREAFKETMARCCGIAPSKGPRWERCYSVLSRSQINARYSAGHSQSTDNSGHSMRDDSYASHALSDAISHKSRLSMRTKTCSLSETTDESGRGESAASSRDMFRGKARRWSSRDLGSRSEIGMQARPKKGILTTHFSVVLRLRNTPPKRKRLHLCRVIRSHLQMRHPKGRYYVETSNPYEMSVHSQRAVVRSTLGVPANNISNSSLKDCDKSALHDELIVYMRGLLEEESVYKSTEENEDMI